MEEIVYLNGDMVPRSQARISPLDYGFLYGYGLFETMRSYNGIIFRLERHLNRLSGAAHTLGLSDRLRYIDLKRACCDTLKANKLSDARVRLAVSAGEGDLALDPDTCTLPTVFIAVTKRTPPPPERYEGGSRAIIATVRRNSQSLISGLKTSCYLENLLAKKEARHSGADEAIMLNERGLLAEGSTSNIFLVSKQVLLTPSLDSGILPGITRETVLELADSLDIQTSEKEIPADELPRADEAFYTTSTVEIMPLTVIDGTTIGSGRAGTITGRLREAYRNLVLAEIHGRASTQ